MITTRITDLAKEIELVEQKLGLVSAKIAGWTQGHETNPYLDYVRADQATFYYPPIETARWRVATATTVGIVPVSPNTWTPITWNEETWNFSPIEYSTAVATSGFFSYDQFAGHAEIMFAGFIRWRQNSSGERLLRFNEYTTNTVARKTICDQAPMPSGDAGNLNTPFCFIHHVNPKSSGFDFEVYQNGGASTVVCVLFAYLGAAIFDKQEISDSTKVIIIDALDQVASLRSRDGASTDFGAWICRTSENSGSSEPYWERTYFQFDLSAVPSNIDILSVELQGMVGASHDNTSNYAAVSTAERGHGCGLVAKPS